MMSEDAETMFIAGSIINLKNCHDISFEGEVIAFDYHKRLLLIKCPSSSGQPKLNDVHYINLEYVKDVKLIKEVKKEDTSSTPLPNLNLAKIDQRMRSAVDEREKLANAFDAGITEDGVKMFLHLCKTMEALTTWEGKNIIVNDMVSISPPYKSENCSPHGTGEKVQNAFSFVKSLVEKFWNDNTHYNTP